MSRLKIGCLALALMMTASVCTAGFVYRNQILTKADRALYRTTGKHTVRSRLARYGPKHRPTWQKRFEKAGLSYPPAGLRFLALKDTRRMEIYARDGSDDGWTHVHALPILKTSGRLGPKRKEGDRQVPEGIYEVDFINPNSTNHLSFRVDYPNADDWALAKAEGRTKGLGGEIYVHGKRTSIGCLAMGDPAIETLFVLVADTGLGDVSAVIAPVDLRKRAVPSRLTKGQPKVLLDRYEKIKTAMQALKR